MYFIPRLNCIDRIRNCISNFSNFYFETKERQTQSKMCEWLIIQKQKLAPKWIVISSLTRRVGIYNK